MKTIALILLLFCVVQVRGQRVLSAADSLKIKALFFTGLHEKMNENYAKASETFKQIILIDSNYAAVYYEIALVNYRQNKLTESEAAAKKAVALDTGNTWYQKLLSEINRRKVPWVMPRPFP